MKHFTGLHRSTGIVSVVLAVTLFFWFAPAWLAKYAPPPVYPALPEIHEPLVIQSLSSFCGCLVMALALLAPAIILRGSGAPGPAWVPWSIPALLVLFFFVDSYSAHATRWLLLFYVPVQDISEEGDKIVTFLSHFGSIGGIVVVGWAIGCLDNWRKAFRFWLILALIGLVSTPIKLAIGRQRPQEPGGQAGYPLLPVYLEGPVAACHSSKFLSFPSGHTTTAAAMSTILTWLYPPGGLLFWALTGGVILHRLSSGAHYFSDVFYALLLGYYLARLFIHSDYLWRLTNRLADLLSGWLDRWWAGRNGECKL